MKVKICGVRTVEDARAAADAGASFVGLNFHPSSPRCIDAETARAIVDAVPGVACVGVFVDRTPDDVRAVATAAGLGIVQLHGEEPPDACAALAGFRVIKALHAKPGVDLAALAARYPVDWVLVDAWVPGMPGGTGRRIDPVVAQGLPADRLFVAGGLDPESVADVVRAIRPFAVDVASGVERAPGIKDHGKVAEFVRRALAA